MSVTEGLQGVRGSRSSLRSRLSGAGSRAPGFLLLVALLALWELSSRAGWIVSAYWPPVSHILAAAVGQLAGGDILSALASTLRRAAVGYLGASAAGIMLGILLARNRVLRYSLLPLIEIVRPMPTPAMIPPLILFLGVDDALKIFIVALASFFPIFSNTFAGVATIDETLIQTARTFRTSTARLLCNVIFPATLPAVAAGLRTATSLCLVVAVMSEMIAGSSGIGYYLVETQYAMRPDLMYAAVLYLAAIGYALNRIFLILEARLIPWMGKS